ncbi:MAG TPA: ParB/RepB/Spo0J family partition protein [Candidatus Acidoferrum sp.]|nr:ParB/RepB/Spo0J family partition protein [Candidatus Acidoferrum sp.]
MQKTTKAKQTKRPTLHPGEAIVRLALGLLLPSPTNRPNRSGMDPKSIAELAESMRVPGIIEPLIVRPHPTEKGKYEIICGERRALAAQSIKLEVAPCIIRQLDDATAHKVQIIENLQREGLHPVEEAQGYADLLEQKGPDGKPINTMQSIAKDIGKSVAFVYGRLKLLEMPKVALDASLNGKCSASIALLLARIPDAKLAYKATIEVLAPGATGDDKQREQQALDKEVEPMSYRRAKEHIQATYMKRLRGAKFDQEDAELVPIQNVNGERRAGGKCSDCPWRTGNLTLLLPGEQKETLRSDFAPIATDVCTNPACFKLKTDAAWKRDQAKAKAQGHTLLRDGKAAQIFGGNGHVESSEYVDVRGIFPGEKKKTWEDVLGDKLPDNLTQARDGKRKVHFLIDREAAAEAAKAVGRTLPKTFLRTAENPADRQKAYQQEQQEKASRRAAMAPVGSHLFAMLLAKAAEVEPAANWWRWLVRSAVDGQEHYWVEYLGLKSNKALEEWIEKSKPEQLRGVLVASVAISNRGYDGDFVTYDGDLVGGLVDACEFYGLNVKKITEDKLAEAKAKADLSAKSDPLGARPAAATPAK